MEIAPIQPLVEPGDNHKIDNNQHQFRIHTFSSTQGDVREILDDLKTN